MVILGKKGLSGVLKILLDLIFYAGILLAGGLWFVMKFIFDHYYIRLSWYYFSFLYVIFMISGILGLFIVNEVRRIFKALNDQNPFSPRNVKSLKKIAWLSFGICSVYIAKSIWDFSIQTVLVTLIFFLAGLFMLVLSEVFMQAVEAKMENDLTI